MLVSQYNPILVVLSFVVAILAAYTALNMAARVAGSEGVAARIWLAGGGIAMGIGVWAMHFIGMLAMDLSMSMSYNATLTVLSMVIAVGSSLFALWLVSCEQLRLRRLLPGALVMGSGIVAMHYTGMAALEVMPGIIWDKIWVAISVVIALAASRSQFLGSPCWCRCWMPAFRHVPPFWPRRWQKLTGNSLNWRYTIP